MSKRLLALLMVLCLTGCTDTVNLAMGKLEDSKEQAIAGLEAVQEFLP